MGSEMCIRDRRRFCLFRLHCCTEKRASVLSWQTRRRHTRFRIESRGLGDVYKRQIWRDVQKRPQAWLGVTVDGTVPKKVGTESDDQVIKWKKEVEKAEKRDKEITDQRTKMVDNHRKKADAARKVIDKKRKESMNASKQYYKITYKDKKKRAAAEKVKNRLDKQLKALNDDYDKMVKQQDACLLYTSDAADDQSTV